MARHNNLGRTEPAGEWLGIMGGSEVSGSGYCRGDSHSLCVDGYGIVKWLFLGGDKENSSVFLTYLIDHA